MNTDKIYAEKPASEYASKDGGSLFGLYQTVVTEHTIQNEHHWNKNDAPADMF